METIFVLLLMIVSFALSASKNSQKKKNAAKTAPRVPQASRQAAVKRAPKNAGIPAAQKQPAKKNETPAPARKPDEDVWETGGGSIEMPPAEPHEHEGKPMPCPAEEREQPRPRPARQAPAPAAAKSAGLQLYFSQNSVVQAVVMAEILKRPEFKNGRRTIR